MSESNNNIQTAQMSKEQVDSIISLTESSKKRLILNDEYICHLIAPDGKDKESNFFSSWEKDSNCPREFCYAFAEVYAMSKFHVSYGMVLIADDKDLSHRYSITLHLFESKKTMSFDQLSEVRENCRWTSMVTTSLIQVAIMPMKFKEFIKLIKYKPEHNPNEPIDSLGLGIARFDCPNKQDANIEYSIEGGAYYEAIDQSQYVEGNIIANIDRYDVKKIDMLTDETAEEFANHINKSLDKIFMGKAVR